MNLNTSASSHLVRPATPIPGRTSPERQAALDALLSARAPITARQVAQQTEASPITVRSLIGKLMAADRIHNARAGEPGEAAYLPGPAPSVRLAGAAPSRAATWMQAPAPQDRYYRGKELQPYQGRPGAMHAFTLPSPVNGRRVERTAPRLISTVVEPWR